MLIIERISGPGNQAIFDYVLRNENSLLYSNPRFIGLLAEHLDAEPGWFVARRNEECVGVLPYVAKRGPLGLVYNSMAYYGSHGGVIQHNSDLEAKSSLVDAFYGHAVKHKACSATLITNPLEQDTDFYNAQINFHYRDERIGQITHLHRIEAIDDLLKQFEDPRPRNIRRAIKAGVTVEKSQDDESLDFLFSTHRENMEAIGGLSKDRGFFNLIEKHMQKHEWSIFTAVLHNEPIAALLVFYFNRTVEYFTPATQERHRRSQPLALIIFKAMYDAIEQGFENWNWGGTWVSQHGVYDFKKRWGTTDYRYFYYTEVFNPSVYNQSDKFLLKHYKGFYVIPFTQLKIHKN